MKKIRRLLFIILIALTTVTLTGCENKLVVFDPQGPVARNLSDLIIYSIIFMAVIVVIVFILFGTIIWKYRERKDNMDYEPEEEEGSKALEITWFVIPVLIVIALTIPTVMVTYELEGVPEGYEDEEPLVIHVTSADWKWVFSYPEQDIETVNYINIPEDRAVQFKMTSTGTMQSFWVPALGGQKYTMANMQTNLYLVADNPGSYIGRNTSFNGKGYAHMDFEVLAQTRADFEEWVEEVKATADTLTAEKYKEIIKPGNVGRMTFNETHLQWIDHAHGYSEEFIDFSNYKAPHGDHGDHGDHEEDETSETPEESNGTSHEGHDSHSSHGNGGE
ncbi:cytochrome aa3 quinol oxidase subunit II [Aquibacillus koreensis]|uniref:Quinol oxidase subunit 2 n=1 Tax=Aquibacillus koreensis TaxID=279446 RepID=A0A9X4AHK1_9BACI|nr:cytochrome aa3 quinol oxidase subunit II [Aquibacillus koreensis]MCT2535746.1 cytochrome aa3 quinol oxidase subunit II [Aquibacillus koreensis]MDC3420202.1 cytochrome aa3 quinol oxidase subunit II [Aquibacillus koreensis]